MSERILIKRSQFQTLERLGGDGKASLAVRSEPERGVSPTRPLSLSQHGANLRDHQLRKSHVKVDLAISTDII